LYRYLLFFSALQYLRMIIRRSLSCHLLWAITSFGPLAFAFAPLKSARSRTACTPATPATKISPLVALKAASESSAASTSNLFKAVAVNGVDYAARSTTPELSRRAAALVKAGMIAFIAGMCIALPLTLVPQKVLYRLGLIDRKRKERWALDTGEFCSRNLLRLIPFCSVETIGVHNPNPQPSVWVCNHTSMLDVFLLMAVDRRLRGRNKRPMKIVYWKGLESNPITGLLFRQAGFISVDMAPNKPGEENDYDKGSFKTLLKDVKKAFDEDYDVALLPEGQLNPTPEKGLQPVFAGAYTLAKMSRRPVQMMALHGIHKLWHPDESIGMTVTGRRTKIRIYPHGRFFSSAEEFKATFMKIVGHFGATGTDLPAGELEAWLTGAAWKQRTS
jgi:1-acyl-sn-glycerol-3-phosphate acyltransferase